MHRQQTHEARIHVNAQRQQGPDTQQHHLAAQVVAHLDLFLEVVGGFVDVVIAQRLKEKVTGLSGGHGDHPGQQRGHGRIDPQHAVSHHKSHGTEQVQGLVDAAVVVVTVIVPTLNFQSFQEIFHKNPSS